MKNRNRVQAQIQLSKPAHAAYLAGNLRREVADQIYPAMSQIAAERGRRIFGDARLIDMVEIEDRVALTFVADTEPV